METRKIKCYLCGCEAEEQDTADSPLDVLVSCPDCKEYIPVSYTHLTLPTSDLV